jgi:hypothetical protein
MKSRVWQIGGFIAGGVLILFGAVAIFLGVSGYQTVHTELNREQIVGSDDMTPASIEQSAQQAGLPASTSLPTCEVAGKEIDTGAEARCFAQYMRVHALESTGGLTYAQMGRYKLAKNPDAPAGTSDATLATKNAEGQPISNAARDIWINENALATALNVSYMAEQLSIFGMVVGIALLLTGIGLVILAFAVFGQLVPTTESVAEKAKTTPVAG